MENQRERDSLLRRGRILEVFTVLWTLVEALVGLALGLLAGSVALVGFGMDSVVEMGSGLVLLWRLQPHRDAASAEHADAIARRLVGFSLLAVAAYVFYEASAVLLGHERPVASPAGIILAVITIVAMPRLAQAKRQVARALSSGALQADAYQATICSYLSLILLGGLLLNALLGWWWADPAAALLMTPFIVREAVETLRGEGRGSCGYCGTPLCTCKSV
jgi:divalent metal cation (Fe/Co/Zn/Cd) transporter